MDLGLLLRAAALQALLVGGLFGLLVLAPLPDWFFREYGIVTGPVAWLVCGAATAAILRLGLTVAAPAVLISGGLAASIGVLVTHTAGLVVAVPAFGAICASLARRPE